MHKSSTRRNLHLRVLSRFHRVLHWVHVVSFVERAPDSQFLKVGYWKQALKKLYDESNYRYASLNASVKSLLLVASQIHSIRTSLYINISIQSIVTHHDVPVGK